MFSWTGYRAFTSTEEKVTNDIIFFCASTIAFLRQCKTTFFLQAHIALRPLLSSYFIPQWLETFTNGGGHITECWQIQKMQNTHLLVSSNLLKFITLNWKRNKRNEGIKSKLSWQLTSNVKTHYANLQVHKLSLNSDHVSKLFSQSFKSEFSLSFWASEQGSHRTPSALLLNHCRRSTHGRFMTTASRSQQSRVYISIYEPPDFSSLSAVWETQRSLINKHKHINRANFKLETQIKYSIADKS